MTHQTKHHPDPLIAAIVGEAMRGTAAIQIHRALQAGDLAGWSGPYAMPISTVRTYIREHRKALNARTASAALEQGLSAAVHESATRVYTALNARLDTELQKKEPVDIAFLDSVAKTLKTLAELAKHKPAGRAAAGEGESPASEPQPVTDPIMRAAQAQRDQRESVPKPLIDKSEDSKPSTLEPEQTRAAATKQSGETNAGPLTWLE